MKTYQHPDATFLVFCKAPVPGQVKTRLTPFLTEEQAAGLHIQLTRRVLRLLDQQSICPVQLWCSPSTEHPFFSECARTFNLTLHNQFGLGLGERMHNALSSALTEHKHAILMGCDCPSLNGDDLREALTVLQQKNDVVLAPAEDGGYVLIGLNRPQRELFCNMDWGTSTVLESTRKRIQQSKLSCHELLEQWDVDIPEDLIRLPEALYLPKHSK